MNIVTAGTAGPVFRLESGIDEELRANIQNGRRSVCFRARVRARGDRSRNVMKARKALAFVTGNKETTIGKRG